MQKSWVKKGLVCGIIMLFVGASIGISPLVLSINREQNKTYNEDPKRSSPTFSPPSPPTLISPGYTYTPGEMIYTLLPTFYWTSVSNADYYGLYISKYPYGPSNLVFDSEVNYGHIYGTQFTLPTSYILPSNERFAWNMRSHNSEGWGGFSSSKFFQTPPVYTITFQTDPINGGTITFNTMPYSNGQVTYVFPMTFNIIANPASGYVFDHWTSTCGTVANPNSASTTVTISSSGTLKAWFKVYYSLTMNACSYGTTSPTSPGTYSYAAGSSVTITAYPASGYHFTGWSGTYAGSSNPYTFTINQNYVETANFNTQTQDDLTADSLELIQVIKNPDQLIINKNAVACINIISSFTNQINCDVKVTYNYGQTYVEKGPGNNGVPLRQGWNRVYVPGGPVIHQSGTPTGAWIAQNTGPWLIWTSTGNDNNIRAVVDCNNEISEVNENNNEIITSKPFFDSKNLRVMVVPVYFPDANPPVGNNEPFSVNILSQEEAVLGMFPVSQNHFKYFISKPMFYTGNPDRKNNVTFGTWLLNNVATKLIPIAKSFNFDRVAIVVHEDWFDKIPKMWGGIALGMNENHVIQEPIAILNNRIYETTVAHEIGHTYYLWHPQDVGPAIYACPRYDVRIRDYETLARTLMSYRDYLKNPPNLPKDTVWIDPNRYEDQIKIRPDSKWQQNVWIWNLFDQFKQPLEKKLPLNQNVILLGGIIYENGTVSPVEPWYNITVGEPNLYPNINGDYFIMLLDKNRNNLSRLGFNISFDSFYDDENGTSTPYHKDSTAFVFSIPFVNGIKFIELWDVNNTVVLSKMISSNAPTVQVISPNGGESFVIGEQFTIEWDAEDLDGNPLSFSVSYSMDGVEWSPIDWSLSESQYIWNTSGLSPSKNYMIRVMACDGINTGFDVSDGTFSLNYPSAILIGRISNLNESENYVTFNANLLFWLSFKPFSFKVYSSNEVIEVSKLYKGRLAEPFILGRFNAVVVSETSSSTVHPLRDRLKQLIAPAPQNDK